ncbi:hypothetical protein [Mariniblastus fucicola]|uniref:Lipoprotein n=1 Tax=Mariniblastus fucicola TaxID=980251 RepID=A0A5B9PKM2_9BACT|nr:hypothetical protein [Mariniblastus fucicola]QEG23211.1 hypothetical protein MFFC18_31070 [Mariniblastus fucicola]
MKTRILTMVLVAVVLSTGCSVFKPHMPKMPSLTRSNGDKAETAKPEAELPTYGTPEKMLAIWKDSVRTHPGKPAMRGFGGRIFLYDQSGAPIRAEGELVIYGFDDSNTERQGSKADQKIVLENSKLQRRYSKSGLGDSYSVWIDWDEVGAPDKSVTLIPFFRTPEGKIVKAGQAIYTLHTPSKEEKLYKEKLVSHDEISSDGDSDPVSQANFIQSTGDASKVVAAGGVDEASQDKSVRTTTIRVPMATQKRLQETGNASSSKKSSATLTEKAAVSDSMPNRPLTRLEEARKKRREAIGEGNVFGMPGQL